MSKGNVVSNIFYGLKTSTQAKEIAKRVVDVMGGGDPAYCLILETACAETQLGTYPDRHKEKWGVGLYQHDRINIQDILLHGQRKHFRLIKNVFGYDMNEITLEDLSLDPLLSTICCRLSYLRIPEPLPTDLYSRAEYWKLYFNTTSGAGTISHYLESVHNCLGKEWQ